MVQEETAEAQSTQTPPDQKVYESTGKLKAGRKTITYEARAQWILLQENEKDRAEIFFTYYRSDDSSEDRPLTFVFNGGPGASSAYLHVGAVGPRRVVTEPDGNLPPAPVSLTDNAESWLSFTDLVFVDPVDTGLSRTIKQKTADGKEPSGPNEPDTFYWNVEKDLDSLCQFMSQFLSKEGRWRSPVFIAGESYGGYRAARLTRRMQEKSGIGLNGVVLISPALEWDFLMSGRFNALTYATLFPTMAAAAHHHGKSAKNYRAMEFDVLRKEAEAFALGAYLTALITPKGDDEGEMKAAVDIGSFLGLDKSLVHDHMGRIDLEIFCRSLFKEEGSFLGRYDAGIKTPDPFPARDTFEGVDPTLGGIDRIFTAGANAHLREALGIDTDREYHLLNYTVNEKWQWANTKEGNPLPAGACDDLLVGMSMNPNTKVMINHGYFDLVTPYFVSDYLVEQMTKESKAANRIEVDHFVGGHMFYTWEASRKAFFARTQKFYEEA